MNWGVWNPTEYLHRSKDPALSRKSMVDIEHWRVDTMAQWQHLPDTMEAINLEAHFRHVLSAFIVAKPIASEAMMGNAILTAVSGLLGIAMFDAAVLGQSREEIMAIVLARAEAVYDYNLKMEGMTDAAPDGSDPA